MSTPDPIVVRQLPVIHKIIADETWLEGERRGCAVTADDPVVRANVCAVILRIGAELRARLAAQLTANPPPEAVPESSHREVA
ncbi:MAG TPA: hypothetical protein VFJ90_02035 [Candidatus Didemnitutus sp.]|nr:hypothetical protein [Candidatus Didemnitutus sp.]